MARRQRTPMPGMSATRRRRRPTVRGTIPVLVEDTPILGGVVDTVEENTFARGFNSPVKARAHRNDAIHVSDVCSKCPRKLALINHFGGYHISDLLWPVSGVTFTIGDSIHDHVVERYRIGSPDKLYGRWSCQCKRTVIQGVFSASQEVCPHCGTDTNTYNEMSLADEEHNMTASMDLLKMEEQEGTQVFTVGEIKSCAGTVFDRVVESGRPLPDHTLQASFYHRMLLVNGYSVTRNIHIIYVCKENRFGQVFKEFSVEPMTDNVNDQLVRVKSILSGHIPERVSNCTEYGKGDSKTCGCAATCFALPNDVDNLENL